MNYSYNINSKAINNYTNPQLRYSMRTSTLANLLCLSKKFYFQMLSIRLDNILIIPLIILVCKHALAVFKSESFTILTFVLNRCILFTTSSP